MTKLRSIGMQLPENARRTSAFRAKALRREVSMTNGLRSKCQILLVFFK